MREINERLKAICQKVGKNRLNYLAEYALGYQMWDDQMEEYFMAMLNMDLTYEEAEYAGNTDVDEILLMAKVI